MLAYRLLVWPSLIAAVVLAGCGREPQTFNDCILENSRGVTSDFAARQVRQACSEKFSAAAVAKSKGRSLSADAMSKIDGRGVVAEVDGRPRFIGQIYNGNKDLTVAALEIELTDKATGKARTYAVDATIEPQGTTEVDVAVMFGQSGANYSWRIAGGKGY